MPAATNAHNWRHPCGLMSSCSVEHCVTRMSSVRANNNHISLRCYFAERQSPTGLASGFLYKPGSYGDAIGYVRTLVGDDKQRSQMGREARLEVPMHQLCLHEALSLVPYLLICSLGIASQHARSSTLCIEPCSRQHKLQPGRSH